MKKALLALPLVLLLTSCSLFSPEPSPAPSPTPLPTNTAPVISPNAKTSLEGSSIEAAWKTIADNTFKAYTESGILSSRVTYPDNSSINTFFFVKPHTFMVLEKPTLSCDFNTYHLTPVFEGVGLPHESSQNALLYVGQGDDGSETPTGFILENNVVAATYTNWEGKPSFTVGITNGGKLIKTYEGTFSDMEPLEALTNLATFDYDQNFVSFGSVDPRIKFELVYEHFYDITTLLPFTTVKDAANVLERSYKHYEYELELLYDFDRDEFYMYNEEKNKLTRLKNGKPSSLCPLPDEF
jgi:hypothetical protein